MLGSNWKTGLAGWLGLIGTTVHVVQDLTSGKAVDTVAVTVAITTSLGLIKAKDQDVTGGVRPNTSVTKAEN